MNTLLPPIVEWPVAYRKLVGTFVAVALIGFLVGAVFLEVTTHMTPEGVVTQYKGTSKAQMDQGGEMKFAKPVKDMLITTHNHILGLSTLFAVMAFLYLHAGGEVNTIKMSIAVEPLASLILTFGGLWVVRFLWAPFVYVVIASGTLMILCFPWMSMVVLRDCLVGEGIRRDTIKSNR